ncbi:MAG: hypothetical protein NTY86_17540 [Deltaproteobacteria bacterium]|nr:hypothetical protein [Deltaproteobacteria bacterium]
MAEALDIGRVAQPNKTSKLLHKRIVSLEIIIYSFVEKEEKSRSPILAC